MLVTRTPLLPEAQAACMTAKVANPTNARGSPSLRSAALFDFFKLGMLLVATYQFNVNSGARCTVLADSRPYKLAAGQAHTCLHPQGTSGVPAASPKVFCPHLDNA